MDELGEEEQGSLMMDSVCATEANHEQRQAHGYDLVAVLVKGLNPIWQLGSNARLRIPLINQQYGCNIA